jgi:hypothetical protein
MVTPRMYRRGGPTPPSAPPNDHDANGSPNKNPPRSPLLSARRRFTTANSDSRATAASRAGPLRMGGGGWTASPFGWRTRKREGDELGAADAPTDRYGEQDFVAVASRAPLIPRRFLFRRMLGRCRLVGRLLQRAVGEHYFFLMVTVMREAAHVTVDLHFLHYWHSLAHKM